MRLRSQLQQVKTIPPSITHAVKLPRRTQTHTDTHRHTQTHTYLRPDGSISLSGQAISRKVTHLRFRLMSAA